MPRDFTCSAILQILTALYSPIALNRFCLEPLVPPSFLKLLESNKCTTTDMMLEDLYVDRHVTGFLNQTKLYIFPIEVLAFPFYLYI